MPLNIEKYLNNKEPKKKRTLKQILKIKWYKFQKKYMKIIVPFMFLIPTSYFLGSESALKELRKVCNFGAGILIWILLIIAFFVFIGLCAYFVDVEKNIDKDLKKTDNKINFKKGFNRLNVIFVTLCTIIFIFSISLWQLEEYNNFKKENIKFYDIKTKNKITDVCNAFPDKKFKNEGLLNGYIVDYYIETITSQNCVCKNFENDLFILEHKKDLYIKMPDNMQKLNKLFLCLLIVIGSSACFYSIMRLLYLGLVKVIEWFFKGFKNN